MIAEALADSRTRKRFSFTWRLKLFGFVGSVHRAAFTEAMA